MGKRIGKYKVDQRDEELSLRDGGQVDGNFRVNGTMGGNYLDFLAGYEGNLTATAVAITDAEADTAGGSAPGAAGIAPVVVSASAVNTFAGDSGAVAAIYLPKANANAHLAIRFTGDMDENNALTIHASGSALADGNNGAAAGTVFSKQVIGPLGAGISVLSGGTSSVPTSNKIIYTPANGVATNCIQAGSTWHFYAIKEDEWSVRIFNVPETTGVTGTFTVA
jgi:hypothetical protein